MDINLRVSQAESLNSPIIGCGALTSTSSFFVFLANFPSQHQGQSLAVNLLTLGTVDKRHICGG